MKYMQLRKIIAITALVIVMAFIFYMSAQPGDDSSGMSRQVCAVVCQTFVQDYDALSMIERENLISGMEFWVRKGAHCFEYIVLGILLYLNMDIYVSSGRRVGNRNSAAFWVSGRRRPAIIFLASLAAGIVCAFGDELHQHFVPGRSCEIRDLMIDSVGVFMGIAVVFLIETWQKQVKLNRKEM